MARTGKKENQQANQQLTAMQQQAFALSKAAIDQYNKERAALAAKGNPYAEGPERAEYLANQNRISSQVAGGQNRAANESLDLEQVRTGMNSAAIPYLKKELAVQRMRTMGDREAQIRADLYDKAQDWKRFLLGTALAPTGAAGDLFGTSTAGRNAALGNLTQLGIASYGPINSLIGAAGQAAGGALSGYYGKRSCWIAEALYGIFDPRTELLRAYLNLVYGASGVGRVVMALYRRFGRTVARWVRKNRAVRHVMLLIFQNALERAIDWRATALEA